jgi:outer membrane protein TolC
MKHTTIITLCLCGAACFAGEARSQEVWSLDRCVAYALGHSTAVRRQLVETDNARLDRQTALAEFLPKVSGNVSAQQSWGRNVDPETNTYNTITTFNNYYQLEASVTLFDGGRTWAAYRQALMSRRQQLNELDRIRLDQRVEVMGKFVDAVYYNKVITLMAAKLDESRQLLAKTQRMEQLGMKSLPDVAQAEAQVAEDEYNLVHNRNLHATALMALKSAMNFPLTDSLQVDTAVAPTGGTADDAASVYASAAVHHPQAQSAYFAQQGAIYDYRKQRGSLFPKISLGAGIATNYYKNLTSGVTPASFGSQFHNNMGEYIYASVSIPLFDFSLYSSVKRARNKMRTAAIDREETLRKLHDNIFQAVTDRDDYAREMKQMERKVESDSLAWHLSRRKYEEGMLSGFDLRTAANTLLDSRTKLLQMQMMYAVKSRLVESYRWGGMAAK